jgi:hypothetical protein
MTPLRIGQTPAVSRNVPPFLFLSLAIRKATLSLQDLSNTGFLARGFGYKA